mgnify:CR=1 FL=1
MSDAAVKPAVTVFVPRDSAALAVGADEVAQALTSACAERGLALNLVRNGSRGMFWLEPLVEVATTTRPKLCSRKCGHAARITLKPPYRCTLSTASQLSGVILWKSASRRTTRCAP